MQKNCYTQGAKYRKQSRPDAKTSISTCLLFTKYIWTIRYFKTHFLFIGTGGPFSLNASIVFTNVRRQKMHQLIYFLIGLDRSGVFKNNLNARQTDWLMYIAYHTI